MAWASFLAAPSSFSLTWFSRTSIAIEAPTPNSKIWSFFSSTWVFPELCSSVWWCDCSPSCFFELLWLSDDPVFGDDSLFTASVPLLGSEPCKCFLVLSWALMARLIEHMIRKR